jgi:hypothetical protein
MLRRCDRCKENSVARRAYVNKNGSRRVVEYCCNKNCGYSYGWEIPMPNVTDAKIPVLSTGKTTSKITKEIA